ncbi:hypothetical protein F4777DRAFT_592080 [Nemania sp. FL0916]|nr:hypothetical protein F4777DRAFT_592080 [Nemania sp. FL0916]
MLLYLLERDPIDEGRSVEIGGTRWGLATHNLYKSDIKSISFTCLSYVWGTKREPNPIHPTIDVSDRTRPALEAVVAHRPSCKRIWVDAYCVPAEAPERNQTLQSMGFVYSRAEEVITVLSSTAQPVLQQMKVSNRLDRAHLDILEQEEWVTRAWTYQEVLNSQHLSMTCEGSDSAIIELNNFLNCLGFTLSHLKEAPSTSARRALYPRLDTLEDLIADYLIAAYEEKSALKVMSQMDRRCQHFSQDHFYAMMGAMSTVCCNMVETLDPCEAFMSACEEKGDYSFIYSTAKRDSSPTRRWRPASAGRLAPVITWHCFGDGQPGHKDKGSVYLDQVVLLKGGALGVKSAEFIKAWLASSKMELPESLGLDVIVSAALEIMGFKGSSQGISTTHGFFFPMESLRSGEDSSIIIATNVQWAFGSPGLLQYRGGEKIYIPGVFFGRI